MTPQMLLALALLLTGASCVIAVMVSPQRTRRQIVRRIGMVEQRPEVPASQIARTDRLGEALRLGLTFGARHRWGMRMAPLPLATLMVAAGAAVLLPARGLGLSQWLAVPAAVFAAIALPRAVLRRQQSHAELALMNQFPDAIDMVIRMLRAGLPIPAIVRVVGREAPPPINRIFTRLADQLDIGLPFNEALSAMSRRIGLGDFSFFAMAVSLQSDTGGNLANTLETLSAIVRRRREIRLKARSSTAEVRVSAWILGCLPFVVAGLLFLVNRSYLTPLVEDPRGNVIVLASIVMLLFGLLMMRQMMRRVTRL